MSKNTPPTSVQYWQAIRGVVEEYLKAHGLTETQLSRRIFGHTGGLKSIMNWNGFGRSPTLDSIRTVESFIRHSFSADPQESESTYQGIFDREIKKARKSLR